MFAQERREETAVRSCRTGSVLTPEVGHADLETPPLEAGCPGAGPPLGFRAGGGGGHLTSRGGGGSAGAA